MGGDKVTYYSSIVQFDAMCEALSASDQYACEAALLRNLTDIRIDVIAHMSLTTELCDMYRGSRKSAIMIHDGVLCLLVLSFQLYQVSVCGSRVGFGAHVCYHCRISPPRFLAECRKR